MRRLLPLLVIAQASLTTSCARSILYSCGSGVDSGHAARVDVRAHGDGHYDLEIVDVYGPGHGGRMCTAPAYAIAEEATLIEMAEGDYTLLAKAEDSSIPYAFPVRGHVEVERGRCYVPGITCDAGAKPDGATCHLVLKATSCAFHPLPRRVVIAGMSYC